MSSDEHKQGAPRSLSKNRMESFSDCIFGFAITLLGVDLAIHPPPGAPLHLVLGGWPTYVAYVVSFLTIGAGWLGHAALTDQLERADSIFLRLNLLLLSVVAFLPFPTRLVAGALRDPSNERVFVAMYGLTLLVIRVLGFTLDAYAKREHLYSRERVDEDLRRDRRKFLPVAVGYMIAILIGLALPLLAMALYFGLAVYLVVPFREVRGLLFPRS